MLEDIARFCSGASLEIQRWNWPFHAAEDFVLKVEIVEKWVMEQLARWNGGRFISGRSQAIFYKVAALRVFKLLTNLNKTKLLLKIVKQPVNF